MKDKISVDITVPGKPVPYKRTTYRQKWVDAGYKRYQDYKAYVSAIYISRRPDMDRQTKEIMERALEGRIKSRCDVYCHFADKRHGDPDNIRKGVLDALYSNDKHVSGSVDYEYAAGWRVDITIIVETK